MATRDDAKETKKAGLERLSLFELVEKFANELITYRTDLSKEVPKAFREQITREYEERTQSIKSEINRREQLYLEGYRTNIRY
jgi:hypothetical protein